MGGFRRERVGRVGFFEGDETADCGAAMQTSGREDLPAAAPA